MAADYLVAVWVRYGILLAVLAIDGFWVLSDSWSGPVAAGVLLYAVVVIHTEPAARYARELREPWYGWMALSAACAHAFGGTAVYALLPQTGPDYQTLRSGGMMQFEALWERDYPSLLEVGAWVGVYALVAAAWAVGVGWASRDRWGTVAPDGHRVRIRRPTGLAERS
ncbi:MAG TPA: hypothetical protein VLK84_02560 [Longimicrobium sp.]|nr:hypothetical protein [Longimicrobium sp.]